MIFAFLSLSYRYASEGHGGELEAASSCEILADDAAQPDGEGVNFCRAELAGGSGVMWRRDYRVGRCNVEVSRPVPPVGQVFSHPVTGRFLQLDYGLLVNRLESQ